MSRCICCGVVRVGPARWLIVDRPVAEGKVEPVRVRFVLDDEPVFAGDVHAEQVGVERCEGSSAAAIALGRVAWAGEHNVLDFDVHDEITDRWVEQLLASQANRCLVGSRADGRFSSGLAAGWVDFHHSGSGGRAAASTLSTASRRPDQ